MTTLTSYWRLMRWHQPAGIALLWAPTAWALWMANQGAPPIKLLVIFLLGTLCMRAAGCIMNDIADRKFDPYVARTQKRPIASGEISVGAACQWLFLLLLLAGLLLIQLPIACIPYAILAVMVTVIYPYCKRFMAAPQCVLGLAFSMGIPMAYVASGVTFDRHFYLLFLLNFLWIVAYDTQYAMADRADDVKAGVRSSAIWFGQFDIVIIMGLQVSVSLLWLILARYLPVSRTFYYVWMVGLVLQFWQYQLIKNRNPQDCLKAFKLNALYGLLLWMAVCSIN